MVGRMLLYSRKFTVGSTFIQRANNVGPTNYVAVGPTLNQRLGFGWRMVSELAGYE